jgi:hypothetical protein
LLAGFTGYKVRLFPVHVGCASSAMPLERGRRRPTDFMKAIGYRAFSTSAIADARDGK